MVAPHSSWQKSLSSQLMVFNFSISFPYHKVRVSLNADLGEILEEGRVSVEKDSVS